MCDRPIEGKPYVEFIGEKAHNFDGKDCAQTFKKFKSVYGDGFE
jgi:hypothetical protein